MANQPLVLLILPPPFPNDEGLSLGHVFASCSVTCSGNETVLVILLACLDNMLRLFLSSFFYLLQTCLFSIHQQHHTLTLWFFPWAFDPPCHRQYSSITTSTLVSQFFLPIDGVVFDIVFHSNVTCTHSFFPVTIKGTSSIGGPCPAVLFLVGRPSRFHLQRCPIPSRLDRGEVRTCPHISHRIVKKHTL